MAVQPSPASISRVFSSSQTETLCPLNTNSLIPLPSPDHNYATFQLFYFMFRYIADTQKLNISYLKKDQNLEVKRSARRQVTLIRELQRTDKGGGHFPKPRKKTFHWFEIYNPLMQFRNAVHRAFFLGSTL